MKKIGFIGYGHMGSMLLNGFINTHMLIPKQIWVSTRTQQKLVELKDQFPTINIASNKEVAKQSDLLFICVKPLDVYSILQEIISNLEPSVHIISIAGGVRIQDITSLFAGKITKIIPSLTSEVLEGITLVCHNVQVSKEDRIYFDKLISSISCVKNIEEENFESASDLTSCTPGLFAAIFHQYVEASVRNSSMKSEEAKDMVIETLYGFIKILKEKNWDFEEIITRVATKGGATEEGVLVLNEGLPSVFDLVFEKTLRKQNSRKKLIQAQFQ